MSGKCSYVNSNFILAHTIWLRAKEKKMKRKTKLKGQYTTAICKLDRKVVAINPLWS